ncbi:dTTP/UTP pyrophosphatase-like [Achroia grisella]|uniref:dTTP/UTP pyrophosphatase-like n=1 Tax=Achroia grisella TaxID=688607 RepID=UPI0027D28EBD|nr:dTTP/UTP pyrophosphatase-like [Achroia grisella]
MAERQLQPLTMLLEKNNIKVIFATQSESRKKALREKGLGFVEYINPDCDEYTEETDPKKYVIEVAQKKVHAVSEKLKKQTGAVNTIIIGADTVVTIDTYDNVKQILTKPKDKCDAISMLKRLSGKKNVVVTGFVILMPDGKEIPDHVETSVEFGNLTDEQVHYYVESGEPMICAGGYAIQGLAGTFIKGIEGDYFSVLGAPVYKICEKLYQYLADPESVY